MIDLTRERPKLLPFSTHSLKLNFSVLCFHRSSILFTNGEKTFFFLFFVPKQIIEAACKA